MNTSRKDSRSPYMEWAKLRSGARFNLSASGVESLPLAELGVSIDQLEINGASIYGYDPLLGALARRYSVPQASVVSAVGTSMANYLALAATTEPGDEILVEHPAYEPMVSSARYLGLRVQYFQRPAENNFAIDLADLARRLTRQTRVIVITNFHNPSGAECPDATLREIAALAREAGAFVMVDEVYREMRFEAEPQTAFLLDPERFVELLSVIALEKLPQIAARMKALLDRNRVLLKEFLSSRSDLDYFWPDYGTVVFPRLRKGTAREFCDFARREFEVSVVPGDFFDCPDRFRIGVGAATELVREALRQLGRALDKSAISN